MSAMVSKPSSSSAPTMRAWAYSARGPPRKVLRLQSVPMPRAPREGEVLVRVSHATLTPAMADVMATIPAFLRWWRPVIPEIDFAGEVAAAGPRAPPNVAAPGTRVFSTVSALQSVVGGQGSLAEYVLVDARAAVVHPAPRNIPLEASAGLGGNGQTARVMLRTGGVKAGQRVFVNGGSTGIGIMLLQMLRDAGVYVVATGSDDKEVLVKSLGADEVIDYRKHAPLDSYLTTTYASAPFDVFFDTIGDYSLYRRSPAYTKRTCTYVNVGAMNGHGANILFLLRAMWPAALGGTPRKYVFQNTVCELGIAQELAQLVEEGKLKVLVDSVWNMEDALKAYDRSMSKRAVGKVVVKVQDL